jgi:hypothetical protein
MYPSNWINASGNLSNSLSLTCIEAIDSSVAFVTGVTGGAYIFKTTNGGSNWVQQLSQPNGQLNSVWMRNASTGFVEGNPVNGRWSLWRTTNGGSTWDSTGRYLPASVNESGFTNSLWCKGDTILFGTNQSRIYFSSNYGLSWVAKSTAPEGAIISLHYSFSALGFSISIWAAGSNYVLNSTNFGTSWTVYQGIPGTGAMTGLCDPNCAQMNSYTNPPIIFMARGNKIYFYDGTGWYAFYTAPSGNYTMLFKKRNEPPPTPDCLGTSLVGIRDNGGVSLCGCNFGGAVKKIGSEIPESFSLSQNYPNPFNPSTKFTYELPVTNYVKLVVCDVLGREVETLVNEQLKPGSYEVEWDGSNYPSGVYFYKLITESFSETKKMVLVK